MSTTKRIFLSVCFLTLILAIHSQTIIYLDTNDKPVKKPSKASKYVTMTRDSVNPDKAETRLYDMGNHLLKLNHFSSLILTKQDGVQREWYLSGQLKSECIMQNGKLNGYNRAWFENGQIKSDSYFKDNLQYGSDKEWYESGQVLRTAVYSNGKKNGQLLTYWKNGQIKREDIYEMDVLKTGQCFDSLGNKIAHYPYMTFPEFPGGDVAFFLAQNIKYPAIAQERKIQGRVIIQFMVENDGSISNINVVRSVDSYLDSEAIRIVQKMPKWKPGLLDGEPVRIKYTLPVNFRLQ
jgi:TonB family C-terminal domain